MSEDGLDTGPANTAPHPSFIANKFLSGNHQFWGKWICITDIFYINIRCVGSGAASPARAARHIFHTHNKSRALTRSCCNPFGLRVILLPSNRHICELTMGHKLHLTFANYFPSALKEVFVNTRVLFISGAGPKVTQCSTAKARLFPEWQGWRKLIEWVVVVRGGRWPGRTLGTSQPGGGILTTCTLFRLLKVNKSGSVCKSMFYTATNKGEINSCWSAARTWAHTQYKRRCLYLDDLQLLPGPALRCK